MNNIEVWQRGDIVEHWACDVDGSNQSKEYIIELDGIKYSVITDMNDNPRHPNRKATIVD